MLNSESIASVSWQLIHAFLESSNKRRLLVYVIHDCLVLQIERPCFGASSVVRVQVPIFSRIAVDRPSLDAQNILLL